jgi:hypothetical protein
VPSSASLKSHITLGEPGIKIILEALPLLPGQEETDQSVSLEIKGDSLFLKAKGSAKDWTEIPIPAKVSGLPVTVAMNRKYLAKALKFGCTQLDIEDNRFPLVFSTKGKMVVVSPLRPLEAKKVPAAPTTPSTSPPENAPAAAAPPPAETTTTAEPTSERNQPPMAEINGTATTTTGNLTTTPPETEVTPAIDLMLA